MYNRKIMEIFQNPMNVGGLKGANGTAKVEDDLHGDIVKIYLKIDENEIIEEARFKTVGSVASIVASSIATELIKGHAIVVAEQITAAQILEIMESFEESRMYSADLVVNAVKSAIEAYREAKEKEMKKAEK